MKNRTITELIILFLIVSLLISGTAYYLGVGPFTRRRTKLVVSTTTSLYDTGLLDALENRFEAEYPIDIYFISAGTGIAITYAQRGDADMILVHDPPKERAFLEGGFGVCRKIIAYNFFVIVGPKKDPVGIHGLSSSEALTKIVEAGRAGKACWVSRGDDSGTNAKEKRLWRAAGFDWKSLRNKRWYIETGTGMGKTLQIANEKEAYTLSDMGTYLKYYAGRLISLVILVSQGKDLLNVYSAIAVNKTYNPEANFDAAITFIKFLVSEEGQQIIEQFGRDKYPQKLFYPAVEVLNGNTNQTVKEWIREYAYFDGGECPEKYQDGHKEMYG